MVQVRNCFFVLRCQPDERETIHLLATNRGISASSLIKGLIADEVNRQIDEGLIEIASNIGKPVNQQQDGQEGKITKDEYIKIIMGGNNNPNQIDPDLRAKRVDPLA